MQIISSKYSIPRYRPASSSAQGLSSGRQLRSPSSSPCHLSIPLLTTSKRTAFTVLAPTLSAVSSKKYGSSKFPQVYHLPGGLENDDIEETVTSMILPFRPSPYHGEYFNHKKQQEASADVDIANTSSVTIIEDIKEAEDYDDSSALLNRTLFKKRRISPTGVYFDMVGMTADMAAATDTVSREVQVSDASLFLVSTNATDAVNVHLMQESHRVRVSNVNSGRTTSFSQVDSESPILLHTSKRLFARKSIEGKKMYIDNTPPANDSWNDFCNHRTATAVTDLAGFVSTEEAAVTSATHENTAMNRADYFVHTCAASTTTATPIKANTKTVTATTTEPYSYRLPSSQKYHTPDKKKWEHSRASNDEGQQKNQGQVNDSDKYANGNDSDGVGAVYVHSDSFLESYIQGPPLLRRRHNDLFF